MRTWVGGVVGTAGMLAATVARAELQADAPALSEPLTRVSIGVRAEALAGFAWGGDVSYLLSRYVGVGATVITYSRVFKEEYHPFELATGTTGFGFVEGRLPGESWATPYLRLGAGVSRLHLDSEVWPYRDEHRSPLAIATELGLEIHGARASGFALRLLGSALFHPTVSQAWLLGGAGAQLGFRF